LERVYEAICGGDRKQRVCRYFSIDRTRDIRQNEGAYPQIDQPEFKASVRGNTTIAQPIEQRIRCMPPPNKRQTGARTLDRRRKFNDWLDEKGSQRRFALMLATHSQIELLESRNMSDPRGFF